MRPAVRTTTTLLMVAAGVAMSTAAATANGTDLRSQRVQDLASLVLVRAQDVARNQQDVNQLRNEVDSLSIQYSSPELAEVRRQIYQQRAVTALQPVTGPGVVVTLNDAPAASEQQLDGVDQQWLLVHQQDIEAVVNALWAGEATAVSLMGQRITMQSAVRCVGSTVLIHGKVFSPPFVIRAIGDPKKLKAALAKDESLDFFRGIAQTFGLTYDVHAQPSIYIAGFTGSLTANYAKPLK